jgi:hypothetical protein
MTRLLIGRALLWFIEAVRAEERRASDIRYEQARAAEDAANPERAERRRLIEKIVDELTEDEGQLPQRERFALIQARLAVCAP